jgi:hypothetical protein
MSRRSAGRRFSARAGRTLGGAHQCPGPPGPASAASTMARWWSGSASVPWTAGHGGRAGRGGRRIRCHLPAVTLIVGASSRTKIVDKAAFDPAVLDRMLAPQPAGG